VKAARAVGYFGAGTVEFIAESSNGLRPGGTWFMEMNTRLQVEHPVTELVTGIDLVHTQIRVAEGEPLGPELDDVQPRGHAIEVRLYAEDPYNRFTPSPGRIERLRLPEGPGIRNDSGVYEGSEVSIHYDPMLAKLIVWAADREHALRRLERALGELRVEGIRTNVPLFRALLADPDFRSGNMDIGMLDRKMAAGELAPVEDTDSLADLPILAAALAHYERANRTIVDGGAGNDSATTSRRSRWGSAARREALRGGSWS
jgi:acetyl-CoA carboxylase biotin carboxylase subunit